MADKSLNNKKELLKYPEIRHTENPAAELLRTLTEEKGDNKKGYQKYPKTRHTENPAAEILQDLLED
jgi:hypothetical protein